MAKTLVSVPSFTAGQLSPRMEGRTDFQKYFSAGTIINNFIVQPHGPVARRPGSYYVCEVKDSTKKLDLSRFHFLLHKLTYLSLEISILDFIKIVVK